MTEQKNTPVKKYRAGAFTASVFNNVAEGRDGKPFEYQSISVQRGYTKDEGKTWENEVINLRANDIMKLMSILQKTFDAVVVADVTEE